LYLTTLPNIHHTGNALIYKSENATTRSTATLSKSLHAVEILEAVAVVEGWEEMRFEEMTAYADAAESRNEPITWSAGASVSECE
jgi:hypothetical protein